MIIRIENTANFSEFLISNIDRMDYRYKYLINVLDAIYNREIEVNLNSFADIEDAGWTLFIEIKSQIFVYGFNYSEDQIEGFVAAVNLKNYKGFEIMGSQLLIYEILKRSLIETYKVIKDRYFYHLMNNNAIDRNENIEEANIQDLEKLVTMFQNYYIEEYSGERNKTADTLRPTVTNLIKNNSLYVFKNGNDILAFCSIIDPDVGIIFTKKEHRKQGIGRELLAYCSSLLFDKNKVVYVMTDQHNAASNKICEKIGYKLIYEHTNLKL